MTRDRATAASVALALAFAFALTLGWAAAARAGAATVQSPATDATPVVARSVAAAVGPYHEFGPDFGPGPPSGANLEIAQDMGKYVNSFSWRGDPPR